MLIVGKTILFKTNYKKSFLRGCFKAKGADEQNRSSTKRQYSLGPVIISFVEIIQIKYMNNLVEQYHRFIKIITKLMMRFKAFHLQAIYGFSRIDFPPEYTFSGMS